MSGVDRTCFRRFASERSPHPPTMKMCAVKQTRDTACHARARMTLPFHVLRHFSWTTHLIASDWKNCDGALYISRGRITPSIPDFAASAMKTECSEASVMDPLPFSTPSSCRRQNDSVIPICVEDPLDSSGSSIPRMSPWCQCELLSPFSECCSKIDMHWKSTGLKNEDVVFRTSSKIAQRMTQIFQLLLQCCSCLAQQDHLVLHQVNDIFDEVRAAVSECFF